jgi:hypothetical protein
MKALKAIAEVTAFHARQDARDECRDHPHKDYDEEYEFFLEDYKGDMYQMLDDAFGDLRD